MRILFIFHVVKEYDNDMFDKSLSSDLCLHSMKWGLIPSFSKVRAMQVIMRFKLSLNNLLIEKLEEEFWYRGKF